jgi:hypothetical protein
VVVRQMIEEKVRKYSNKGLFLSFLVLFLLLSNHDTNYNPGRSLDR